MSEPTPSLTVFMEDTPANEITAMNDTARGFVMSIRAMHSEKGEQLRKRISDELTPEMMFNRGTAPFPSLWSNLRKFLVDRNVQLKTHIRHRTIYTIANTIFADEDENEVAIELARRILNGNIYLNGAARPEPIQQTDSQDTMKKTAHNVAMRLKDADQKFSGDLSECWEDYKDEYEQISEDYNLSDEQKLKYLHNLLRKDAHRFYLESVKPNSETYDNAVELLEKEYNSIVRQTRVKNHLNSLRLTQFITADTDTASALAKVYKRILNMSRQVPLTHRGDAHKIEFLRTAVVGQSWARVPLSRVATEGLTFQQLYSELEIAVQLERESLAASSSSPRTHIPTTDADRINFVGQGKYVRRNGQNGHQKQRPPRKRACFNCGSDKHLIKHCPHPINFSRAAAGNIKRLNSKRTPNAVHIVLAHLCNELDQSDDCKDECDPDDDDVKVFEQLLVSNLADLDISDDHTNDDVPIFSVQVHFAPTTDTFWGACVDSGAQRTVIGRKQADAYISQIGDATSGIKKDVDLATRFRFGDTNHNCDGILHVKMPVADDVVVHFDAFIVPIDVPLLLGLDVLKRLDIIIKFSNGTLQSENDDWVLNLKHKMGHLYVEWPPTVFYTEQELRRIHRHFYHPSTDKLANLIRRGAKDHDKPGLRRDLDHIRETCEICQRLAKAPGRFRVAIPNEECTFNRSVGMDLMKINKQTALHMVDKDTKFGAAVFLESESSKAVWEAFLSEWVATYIGFPDEVTLDQGPQFQSKEFGNLLLSAGIKRRDAGVESHNSLGETERYHAFLRNVYERVHHEHTDMKPKMLLKLTVKACNDVAGPSGLVPTLLVFGSIPRMPIHPEELPTQRARMTALHKARAQMTDLMAKSRLSKAINMRVPKAADRHISIGDMVLIYRDDPGKWIGPMRVIDTGDKSVLIDWDGRITLMSIDRCRPFLTHTDAQEKGDENGVDNDDARPAHDDVITAEDRENAKNVENERNVWDFPTDESLVREFLVRILSSDDPRINQPDFVKAKQAEIDGLQKRGTWERVKESSISHDANIVGGRFIHTLKNFQTPEEMAKVRYVAQGFADFMKHMLAHDVTALRPASIRLILSIASILGLRLFLLDVMQAYLQAKDLLTRVVYLRPKPEDMHLFGLATGYILKLLKPLYGLCDSGDYWNKTIDDHLTDDLGMEKAVSDVSLYFRFENGKLIGITGNYVDDNINAGNDKFQKESKITLEKFESKPRTFDTFSFFGTQVSTIKPGEFFLSQSHYMKSLTTLPKDADITQFRRARSMLAWTLHCRPKYACIVNKSAQVTEKTLSKKHINDLNRAIRDAQQNPSRGLTFAKLDIDTVHLRVYADASFASNDDLTSQLGFLILLCDDENKFHVLDHSSRKSRRVVRSIMGAELYAFTDAFDTVANIAADLSKAFAKKVLVRMLTDSKQVFDVITRGKRPTEKRLAIDVVAAREAYLRFDVDRVGLVKGENNPADALSKLANNGKLSELLDRGVDETPVESWIMRSKPTLDTGEKGSSIPEATRTMKSRVTVSDNFQK